MGQDCIVFILKRGPENATEGMRESFIFIPLPRVFVIKVIYLHLTPHHSISIYEIHFNFVVRSLTLTQSRAIKTFSESKECVLLFQEKSKSFTNLQTLRILLNYIENIINIYLFFFNIWKYEKLLWVFLHFRDR